MKGSKTMRYSVTDTSQLYNAFNTVTKRYPNGDVSIKKLKFTAFKKNNGWEETDHEYTFLAKEKEAEATSRLIYGDVLWEHMRSKSKIIDTNIETLETQSKIEKQPFKNIEEYDYTPADTAEREKYLRKKAMDNIVKTRSKIYDIARSNEWNYFITLTFNDRVVDRYNYQECMNKISNFFHNFKSKNKKTCPNFRYLIIHEKHDDGAYHFHGLMYLEDESENMLTKALYPLAHKLGGKPILKKGKQVYNWSKYNHGYSTVTRIQNLEATCKYILKYVTKDLDKSYTKGRRRFMYSSNCLKPEIIEHISSDDDYNYLEPIYDSQFSTGYEYNQKDLLVDLFGGEIDVIND